MSELESNKSDLAAAVARSVVGAAPFVGSLVAEVVTALIPNQRIDRIARLVEKLDKKVAALEKEVVQRWFTDPEFVDLLEDAFVQGSRALSDERLEYLSSLLKNTLSGEALIYLESKRVLSLLGELNDAEVIILASHSFVSTFGTTAPFHAHREELLRERLVGAYSPTPEMDEAAIHESFSEHLEQLGLLRPEFRRPRRGEAPEFDPATGMIKRSGRRLTQLGDLLLRRIDMERESDAERPGTNSAQEPPLRFAGARLNAPRRRTDEAR